jgi:glutamine synthetase
MDPIQDSQGALRAFLTRHPDTRHIDAFVFDLNGNTFGKRYPIGDAASLFAKGMRFSPAGIVYDARGKSLGVGGFSSVDGDPDATGYAIADLLAPVPWSPTPAAQVLVDPISAQGCSLDYDPRAALKRIVAKFAALGLTPVVAFEYEFYLIEPRCEDGVMAPARCPRTGGRRLSGGCLWTDKLDDFGNVLRRIEDACAAQAIPCGATSSEYSSTQFEINLHHIADAVRAADLALLQRRAVRGAARSLGLDATFMAKPFPGEAGSGLHVHVSLADQSGENLFDDRRPEGDHRLRAAIGGMKASFPEFALAFAPSLNSFRRYVPGVFAPVDGAWGIDNRTVAFRTPREGGAARRIEHRIAGADANPYMVLTAVLGGILKGLQEDLDPGPPATDGRERARDQRFPRRLWDAIDGFRRSDLAGAVFGPLRDIYADQREAEAERLVADAIEPEWRWGV